MMGVKDLAERYAIRTIKLWANIWDWLIDDETDDNLIGLLVRAYVAGWKARGKVDK
jgi:hypothetical protein